MPGISASRSLSSGSRAAGAVVAPCRFHHKLGISEKSRRPALIAAATFAIVTGPSLSTTKSTSSSASVCAGSAAGWVPVMRILRSGLSRFTKDAMLPAAVMFCVDADGWNP
jgi:hypothetical protein